MSKSPLKDVQKHICLVVKVSLCRATGIKKQQQSGYNTFNQSVHQFKPDKAALTYGTNNHSHSQSHSRSRSRSIHSHQSAYSPNGLSEEARVPSATQKAPGPRDSNPAPSCWKGTVLTTIGIFTQTLFIFLFNTSLFCSEFEWQMLEALHFSNFVRDLVAISV